MSLSLGAIRIKHRFSNTKDVRVFRHIIILITVLCIGKKNIKEKSKNFLLYFRWISLFNADGSKYAKHHSIFHVSCLYHHLLVKCHSRYGCNFLFQQKSSNDLLQLFSRKFKSYRFNSSWLKKHTHKLYLHRQTKHCS